MKYALTALAGVLLLAACGQHGAAVSRGVDVCALIDQPQTVFAHAVTATPIASLDGEGGGCDWASSDGVVTAQAIVYTPTTLPRGGDAPTTLPAAMDALVERLRGMSQSMPGAVEGLEGAVLFRDMPGAQIEIVARKGENVIVLMARTDDAALASETLAQRLATALAGKL